MNNEPRLDRRTFLRMSGGLAAASMMGTLGCRRAADDAAPARPNIVVIMADGLGFSDIGCFGGEIDTPSLNALASDGVRFTQFYNAGRSCPSRASLLTGLYPHQAGLGHMVYEDAGDGYRGNLNDRSVTSGEVLAAAGYDTLFVGKWHAGYALASRPEVRGFNRVTAVYAHVDSYWRVVEGCEVYRDRKVMVPAGERPVSPYQAGSEFYVTDFFTDAALEHLDAAAQPGAKPFLLHVCYNAPLFPLEAPGDLIAKYRGRYRDGWERLREEKLDRLKSMGMVAPGLRLPIVKGYTGRQRQGFAFEQAVETGALPEWASLTEDERAELDFRRAMYAAQVDRLDWNIGRLVDRLKARGVWDNTLILFCSGSGSSGEGGLFGLNWGTLTSGNYEEWRRQGGRSISQGQCWASASNAPLSTFERFVHEGGIASPFIAHWPARIQQAGRICSAHAAHLVDIMPTLCELTGTPYPETYGSRRVPAAAGRSLVPYFDDVSAQPSIRPLYWQHETCSAVHRDDWKLVTVDDRNPGAWELYDLEHDRGESDNRATHRADLVQDLADEWQRWAAASSVLPFPEARQGRKAHAWPPPSW